MATQVRQLSRGTPVQARLEQQIRRLSRFRLGERDSRVSTTSLLKRLVAAGILTKRFAQMVRRILIQDLTASETAVDSTRKQNARVLATRMISILQMVPDRT